MHEAYIQEGHLNVILWLFIIKQTYIYVDIIVKILLFCAEYFQVLTHNLLSHAHDTNEAKRSALKFC